MRWQIIRILAFVNFKLSFKLNLKWTLPKMKVIGFEKLFHFIFVKFQVQYFFFLRKKAVWPPFSLFSLPPVLLPTAAEAAGQVADNVWRPSRARPPPQQAIDRLRPHDPSLYPESPSASSSSPGGMQTRAPALAPAVAGPLPRPCLTWVWFSTLLAHVSLIFKLKLFFLSNCAFKLDSVWTIISLGIFLTIWDPIWLYVLLFFISTF